MERSFAFCACFALAAAAAFPLEVVLRCVWTDNGFADDLFPDEDLPVELAEVDLADVLLPEEVLLPDEDFFAAWEADLVDVFFFVVVVFFAVAKTNSPIWS